MRIRLLVLLPCVLLAGCISAFHPERGDLQASRAWMFSGWSSFLDLDYISTRGNTVTAATGERIELNVARFARKTELLTMTDSPLPDQLEFGLWVGYDGEPALGLGDESTLVLVVDGERFEAAASGTWKLESLLRRREVLRIRRTVRVAEVDRDTGEFAMFEIDRSLARRLRDADAIAFEVRGARGEIAGALDTQALARIQALLLESRTHGYL